jgi:hypothetical protein
MYLKGNWTWLTHGDGPGLAGVGELGTLKR